MENNNEIMENRAAAILAGLSKNVKKQILHVIENSSSIQCIEGKEHYKRIRFQDGTFIDIKLSFEKLLILLPEGLLEEVHQSWWLNFAHVKGTYRLERDRFALMCENMEVPIGRSKAKAFKKKCEDLGII